MAASAEDREPDVDADARLATAQELANMVSGRLDAWLKSRSLATHSTLPATRAVDTDEGTFAVQAGEGFSHRFAVAGLPGTLVLRGRARPTVAASTAA